jgi:hypothetical protein
MATARDDPLIWLSLQRFWGAFLRCHVPPAFREPACVPYDGTSCKDTPKNDLAVVVVAILGCVLDLA